MKAILFAVFMLVSVGASADDFVCVAFKAVALLDNGGNEPSITEVDVTSTKYHLKKTDTGYTFQEFGSKAEIPCVDSSLCSCGPAAWCGSVTRTEEGFFTLYSDKEFIGGAVGSAIVKGKCVPAT